MSVVAWDGKTLAADRAVVVVDTLQKTRKIRRIASGEVLAWVRACEAGLMTAQWYEDGADPDKWPKVQDGDRWGNLIVASHEGCFEYEQNPIKQPVRDSYAAWGSGSELALGAMAAGADAFKAVEIACKHDGGCGFGCDSYVVDEIAFENSAQKTAAEWLEDFYVHRGRFLTPESHAYHQGQNDMWQACNKAVSALIKPGSLSGNGLDKTAERNGLILASNFIMNLQPKALKTL